MNAKSTRIEIRTDLNNKQLIEKAASLTGHTLSSYVLSKIISIAQKDIEEVESIQLDNEDRDLFYKIISDPPEPNDNLKNLLKSEF